MYVFIYVFIFCGVFDMVHPFVCVDRNSKRNKKTRGGEKGKQTNRIERSMLRLGLLHFYESTSLCKLGKNVVCVVVKVEGTEKEV